MPSPFPGMDPFLEGSLSNPVHTQLSAVIAWQLAPKVRPKYLVLPTERFVLDEPDSVSISVSGMYPDVSVAKVNAEGSDDARGTTVTAPTIMPASVPHVTIEIRDTANRQLVTAIEVLSPANKRGGGRDEYLAKRRHVLLSSAHLVEIDLLRRGHRVPMLEPLPAASYFVFVSRAENRPKTDCWPIRLDQPLPRVPIPLLLGDQDVELDLNEALTSVYDRLGLDLAVDYSRSPEIPFRDDEAETATRFVRS